MTRSDRLRLAFLTATAITSVGLAAPAFAQEQLAAADTPAAEDGNEIIVTATRRAVSLQDVPINISAISADQLKAQRVDDIRDIADFTPGLTISDTGPRGAGTIVMRGLSASDVSADGNTYDDAMGIYLGEVPLYYDFKLLDIDRVETLLGPQGTLYGLGTLAGAIRYIPARPNTDKFEVYGHGRFYGKGHASKAGYQADGMVNIPILKDHIAFRSSTGYYYDPGFIDSPLVLNTPGVSLPQAGGTGNSIGSAYKDNLHREKDVNFEKTFTTRNQLLVQASEDLKGTFTYAYQQTKTDGSQSNSNRVLGTGKYENGARYLEPAKRQAQLVAFELNANLFDIADLVSTTAYTEVKNHTIGDVTDLLLDLDYDYEAFPAFSGFNEQRTKRKQFNQEIRLVSRHGGPFSWVLGGFYNRQKYHSDYAEHTVGLANFYGITDNPEDLEYVSFTDSKVTEKAVFGEGSFKITDAWQVTAGARYFKYSSYVNGGLVLPLLGDPLSPYDASVAKAGGKGGQDGVVWKFNTSYKFTPDIMAYVTYSKGYRIGGPNRVAPCPDPLPVGGQQNACALPNEQQYGPDKTKNLEIGVRAGLFDRKLTVNFDVYKIKWNGIQVDSATFYGVTGITVNGGTAESKGFEASFQARPVPQLTISGTYSYTDAKLTEDVPGIVTIRTTPGDYDSRPKFTQLAALDGDRLPGSAKNAGSLGATYTFPIGDGEIAANWTATYRGNVVSRLGWERAYGDKIPAYTTHRTSITWSNDTYSFGAWMNNVFDKYAYNSVSNDRSRIGINDGVAVRYYARSVINPRTFGLEGSFKF